MKPSEVAALLSMIVFYDPKVQFDEGKLVAWHRALIDDMPLEFAKDAVNAHYARSRDGVMPADLNAAWVVEVRTQVGRYQKEQFELEAATAEAEAVEPPAEIIAELQKILGGGVNRQALEVQCPHCNAEPHNRCTLSDGSVLTKSVAHPARMKKAGVGDAPVAIRKSNSAPNA